MKSYSCLNIADYFLNLSNDTGSFVSNLKLQKLVYYSQAWHLAIKNTSLFDEDFQAWVHGPVVYDLWKEFSPFTYKPILKDIESITLEKDTLDFLSDVADTYFNEDAYTLELMTHREDPWIIARGQCEPDERCTNIITKESMKEYYKARLGETA